MTGQFIKGGISMEKKTNRWGWAFLIVASAMIMIFSFYPMFSALIMSFKTGSSANMKWATPWYNNYLRMFKDKTFIMALKNTFLYLIIQVPVMLVLAILLAQLLNNPNLKCRGLFRTCIFLPCAISLVSYSLIFRTLFYDTGMINTILMKLGIIHENIKWLGQTGTARAVIITALIWRWTGYNMVFYLAGLQNLDYQVYEAAQIDGANGWKTFWHITVPQLRPVIIMTFIMSINGTLQLYDESVNLTNGGPAGTTMTMSHHIYNTAFQGKANFGYAAALSFVVFILVAILAAINLKVGDTRD
jgi:lactose/L-arabinose transport system permease protein